MSAVFFWLAVGTLAVVALMLWQRARTDNNRRRARPRIIGGTAYVGSGGLRKNVTGEVTWAGTINRAELAKDLPVESLAPGSAVTIVEASGAKLIVKPK